jgi:putative membrane protein
MLKKTTEVIAVIMCFVSLLILANTIFFTRKISNITEVTVIILFTLVVCILHAAETKGVKKALGFSALSFAISWFVEFIGCNYGWWFGDYEYTTLLGIAIGNVPLLVVVSWETIIYPSHLLADELISKHGRQISSRWLLNTSLASLVTALLATSWDLMTDPIAVTEKWWIWDFGVAYLPEIDNGIPFSNFWGWVGAVFLISFLYRIMFNKPSDPVKHNENNLLFASAMYTSMFLGSINTLLLYELYMPIIIGIFTMGPIALIAWAKYFSTKTKNDHGAAMYTGANE